MDRRYLSRIVTASLSVLLLVFPLVSSAESIWQHSKGERSGEEQQRLRSIERVFAGTANERDLLHVRVALVALGRGEIEDPRTVVLLVRLRRELAFGQGRLSERQLSEAVQGKLSHTLRAWAHLELAHLSLAALELKEARRHLQRGLEYAWRADVVEEILLYSAWLSLREGRDELSELSFLRVERHATSKRSLLQARVGRALLAVSRGKVAKFERLSSEAIGIEDTRAAVSGRDPFWELDLNESDRAAVRVVMTWKQEGKSANANDDSPVACSLLFEAMNGVGSPEPERGRRGGLLPTLARVLEFECSDEE